MSGLLLSFALALTLAANAPPSDEILRLPLGSDQLTLQPAGVDVFLFVTVESPDLTWNQNPQEGHPIRDREGKVVRQIPSHMTFRVTAGTRGLDDSGTHPLVIETDQQLNEFLLGLQFRVRVVRGLESRLIEPEQVRMLGVPKEVTYDERIYSVDFKLPKAPIEDRVVLEILSAGGDRVGKFVFALP